MYTGGFRQLWQGWTKNIYEAATCIPLAILLLVVLLIAGYSTAVFVAVLALTSGEGVWCFAAATCYILCVLQIIFVSHRIGNFHFIVAIFYPVFLVGFILIFIASAFKKLILRKTKWKGRDVPL
jgi:4,4'-diaponeurosporenoate glycosyltransferase